MMRLRLLFSCFLLSATIDRTNAAEDTARSITSDAPPVSFSQEVRPILSANCFACHGRDDEVRQADLRLDQRAAAIESGGIVPGDSGASLLVKRITSNDPEMRMPPRDSGK